MKYNVDNETLTIFLEGQLNSYNSDEIEKEIDEIMKNNSFKKVILDLENLHYISSAGLRIIVTIKIQYDDLTLTNTPPQVYEVFDMVGFKNMIKIEKLK